MIHGGFRHLPVVEDGKVVGIVSIRDLMRVALDDRSPRGVLTDWGGLLVPDVRALEPLDVEATVGEVRALAGHDAGAKLDWNENLFGPLPGVLEAAGRSLAAASMYPIAAYDDFCAEVRPPRGGRPEHGRSGPRAAGARRNRRERLAPAWRRRRDPGGELLPLRARVVRPRGDRPALVDARVRARPRGAGRDGTRDGRPDRMGLRPQQPDGHDAVGVRVGVVPRRAPALLRRGRRRGVWRLPAA